MSRKITLNLELNQRLSRASNYTPNSERSNDTLNASFASKASICSHSSKLKESILRSRETIRSKLQSRRIESVGLRPTPSPLPYQ